MTHVSDEFLSAHMDGEPLSAGDAAHLDECEQCSARLGVFRGVSAGIAAAVNLPAPHVREAAVAAALAKPATAAKARVVRRANALSAAAVLLVALGVGAAALSQLGGGSDDADSATTNAALDMRTESATAPSDDDLSTMMSAPADAGAAGGGISVAIPDAGDIGAYDATEPIAQRYRAFAADPNSVSAMLSDLPCPVPDGQPVDWHASLTFDGEPAYARVLSVNGRAERLEVLRRTTCEVLATQTF